MQLVRQELGSKVGLALSISEAAKDQGQLVPPDAYDILFRAAELSKIENHEPRTIAELVVLASINDIVPITE